MELRLLNELPPDMFADIYNYLECINLSTKQNKSSRRGFLPHKAEVFGITRQRYTGKVALSKASLKYPEIYQELIDLGNKICPFDFNAIHINHNVICPPHKDDKNVGDSLIVSFGDYTGAKLMVEGVEADTDCRPVIFNGNQLEHWNTDDLVGNKYSLVFYKSPYSVKN